MDSRQKKRLNRIQNFLILALTLSAAALLVHTQLSHTNQTVNRYFSQLFAGSPSPAAQSGVTALTDLSVPVQVAVTGTYGRYGSMAMSTTDEAFSPLGTLLGEAVGSAGDTRSVPPAEFRSALEIRDGSVSLYFDFGNPLPMSVVAGLVNVSWTGADLSARRLLLYADDSGSLLYLWDGAEECLLCSTAVSAASLRELADSYPQGGAFFAFDQWEERNALAPFSLFTSDLPEYPVLSAGPLSLDFDALLSTLAFNPHTNFRYTESSGAEVVVESDRSVRIRMDGSIAYQSSAAGPLAIAPANHSLTDAEAVTGVFRLLNELRAGSEGGAVLYLRSVGHSGAVTTLAFDYQYNGLPIVFSDGSPAAEVRLENGAVTRLTLRLRQYTATESTDLLLPLTQAEAIARRYPGAELALRYMDSGGDSLSAQWLANS